MTKKRNTNYAAARNSRRPPAPDRSSLYPQTSVDIDLQAVKGRAGLTVGTKVRIAGTGLYSGEIAVIERLTGSVVPSAVVRTEAGNTRQVRTIDLEPVS